jgi:antiviral helicase SLH1
MIGPCFSDINFLTKNGTDTSSGKVNILLQGFISRELVDDFALVSDMAYVAQNAGRIARALVEIAVSRKWANVTATLIGISKAIESRRWPYEHPLRQMNLKSDTSYALEKWADDLSVAELAGSESATLGQLVHLNEAHGQAIIKAAKQFPTLDIRYVLRPIAVDILRISLEVIRKFDWNAKLHTGGEPFWLWVENEAGSDILQISQLLFHQNTTALQIDFSILVDEGDLPQYVTVKAISDRWSGSEETVRIALDELIMPLPPQANTKVISLPFLNLGDIGGPQLFKEVWSPSIRILNTLQTQAFWNVVYSRHNSLLCAPGGSGKSTLGHMCVWYYDSFGIVQRYSNQHHRWHILQDILNPTWILIIVPTKIAALDVLADLDHGSRVTQIPVQLISDSRWLFSQITRRAIRVVPADILLRAFSKHLPEFRGLSLVLCDVLERLDPAYELALSLLRLVKQSSSTRFVGISTSLNDHGDMAKWFGVRGSAITSFGPKDHDQSLTISLQSFSTPYSSSLFKSMAKPTFRAIRGAAPESSALVFVPSRGHARSIAQDLITQCTLELETARGYAPTVIPDETLQAYSKRFDDASLKDFVTKGVGFFYAGLEKQDRALMLEMFAEGMIRVLIVPRSSCWTIPIRATLVIVMGTQYAQVEEGVSRQIKDYTLLEIARMKSRAVQQTGHGHFHLFCPAEAFETYSRFLDEGLPLESRLHESLILREWVKSFFPGRPDKQQLMDVLSFTYLAQRLVGNPFYYGFRSRNLEENLSRFVDKLVEDVE